MENISLFEFLHRITEKKKWKKLIRYVRVNDVKYTTICDNVSDNVGNNCFREDGLVITKTTNRYYIDEISCVNKKISFSSITHFDTGGKLVDGIINCFNNGVPDIDEQYVQDLFKRFLQNKIDNKNWEFDIVDYY